MQNHRLVATGSPRHSRDVLRRQHEDGRFMQMTISIFAVSPTRVVLGFALLLIAVIVLWCKWRRMSLWWALLVSLLIGSGVSVLFIRTIAQ